MPNGHRYSLSLANRLRWLPPKDMQAAETGEAGINAEAAMLAVKGDVLVEARRLPGTMMLDPNYLYNGFVPSWGCRFDGTSDGIFHGSFDG